MYLRIVNPGEADARSFTVLGLSTARGRQDTIGQFGSGNKHAVNLCLRSGINPLIFCGGKRIEFFTQPEEMEGQSFNRVYCKVSNRKPEALSMTAEYGELDWKDIGMALREFVSNALDAADGDSGKVKIDIVDKVTARQGKTIVAIPLTPQVQEWYSSLHWRFLHFRQDAKIDLGKEILPKSEKQQKEGFIYRKGVMVRTIGSQTAPSIFNYNFGEELEIDEARNLSSSQIRDCVATKLASGTDELKDVFQKLATAENFWERDLPAWELSHGSRNNKSKWKELWEEVHGSAIVALHDGPLKEFAEAKGYRVIIVSNANWYDALSQAGIDTPITVLGNVNDKGHVFTDPTAEGQEAFDEVWTWLELIGLTQGKEKPTMKIFQDVMNAGCERLGYYLGDICYLRADQCTHRQTILEEIAHHVTGSSDCTRDFQDYAFKCATLAFQAACG